MKNCLRQPPDYGIGRGGKFPVDLSLIEYEDTCSSVIWKINVLHREHDGRGEIIVGVTREFGYVLFYEGEIQITESDFKRYHDFVATLAGCWDANEILIVGDGDGGFTKYPWTPQVTYVEPSRSMRIVGERYFGARWDRPRAVNSETLQSFLRAGRRVKFDTAILAITDSFSDGDGLCNVLEGVAERTNKMVCTVGTVNDPGYYRNLPKFIAFGEKRTREFGFYTLFCPGFMSEIVFFVGNMDA